MSGITDLRSNLGNFMGERLDIPASFPEFKGNEYRLDSFNFRTQYVREYCFAHVNEKWVKPLAGWLSGKRILEVMAGKGYLARVFKDYGLDIKATDNYSWIGWNDGEVFMFVENLDAIKAVEKYRDWYDIVLMCWPPYTKNIAFEVVKSMGGSGRILYIGEGPFGSCANRRFFENVEEIHSPFLETVNEAFRSFEGINDRVVLYKPKEEIDENVGEYLGKEEGW